MKIKPIVFALTLAILLMSPIAFAQVGGGGGGGNQPPKSPIKSPQDIVNILKNVVVWVYQLFFIAAVGFILWAAFLYLTARDDMAKVTKAKTSLKNAIIAVAIALIASGVSAFLQNILTNFKQQ